MIESFLNLVGKFRMLIAWFAGFMTGQKIEKLQSEVAIQKAKLELLKERAQRIRAIEDKWEKIRASESLSAIDASMPQQDSSLHPGNAGL